MAGHTRARRERKVVTVLFADLAGFTARAETMDPEDVAALLDPYHARLKRELERFGGTVEKFIGDAVMAVFGAPVAHEDDAERAVRAAVAIRDWAAEEQIDLRIGVNTGEALVTLGARPAEGQALAAGDVVNTAARLQAAAPTGGILVGRQTFRATERVVDYEAAEPIAAKGKSEPVPAWLARGARSRAHVERAHGAALVGRARELELVAGSLDRARREASPELVTLVGVPGIGKSRLVLELYSRIDAEPELTSWRHGRCLPYGDGVTFWALGEMVKAQAGILEGDDEEETARKLSAAASDPWVEAHLRPLVGLPGGPEGGTDRRDEAFAAWRRYFEDLADERPLVLVFEDIHWADDDLLDFVDHLIDWATGVPLLVVCTARPELLARRPGWGGGKPNAITVTLAPLSDDDTVRLLSGLLERSVLPADTQRTLLARAGGNPLYAEEYARVLREHGALDELPESVHGLIAARIDLLDSKQKALLQDASVIGRTFWLGVLGDDVTATLHELERREFVRRERQSSVAGETEYAFRHVLVRDVAYGQIPRAERAAKHLDAARWIERLARPDDHAEMLAHHYLEALELARVAAIDVADFAAAAGRAFMAAGDRALALNAYDAARRYYHAALNVATAPDPHVLLRLGRVAFLLGEDAVDDVSRARDELIARGDVEGAATAENLLCEHLWLAGDRAAAWAHIRRARELVEPLPLVPIKARTIATVSRLHMLAEETEEAVRLGDEAIAMAESLGLDEIRAAALINVGTARSVLGDDTGLELLEEAARVADDANAMFEFCRAKGNLAVQLALQGRLRAALDLWQEAAVDARRFGQTGFARWFDGVVTPPQYSLGDWTAALAGAEAFIAAVEGGAPHYLASQCYTVRCEIRLARDDVAGALADVSAALELGDRAGDPQSALPARARGARIYLEAGETDRAREVLGEYIAAFAAGLVGYSVIDADTAALVAVALGLQDELGSALSGYGQPWARAAAAYTGGDPLRAAEIIAETGAVTREALILLGAARQGVELGGAAQHALAFFRSVGATRYVRELEAMTTRAAISGA